MALETDIIFLVGARAAGKTSVGRRLAEATAREFADTDLHLSARRRQSVAEIVAELGWPGFRELESGALRALGGAGRRVVATGGGLAVDGANRAFMRERGLVFYLSAPAETLAARLAADPGAAWRPSLTGRAAAEETARVLADREDFYRQAAHRVVDAAAAPDAVAEDIRRQVAELEGNA